VKELCEKCGREFETWDDFQRHGCVMGALRELQEVKRDARRSEEDARRQA
jgi:hypothetical protein